MLRCCKMAVFTQLLQDSSITLAKPPTALRRKPLPNLQTQGCAALAQRLRPCFGPRGLSKSRLFRFPQGLSQAPAHSADTGAVLANMDLSDPHARTLASAASAQMEEVGDGTALVLLLGASLLEQAQTLLSLGLEEEEIQQGYRQALRKALELMESDALPCSTLPDPRRHAAAGLRDFLSTREPRLGTDVLEAVAQCCVLTLSNAEEGVTFDPRHIKVVIVTGESLSPEPVKGTGRREKEESTVEQRDEEDGHNGIKEEGGESWGSNTTNDEGDKEARGRGEEPLVEEEGEEAPTRKERQEQATARKCRRADGQIEVEDEVRNGEREGEDEWEDWVDIGLETDELRSDRDGEQEDGSTERDEKRGDRHKGDVEEMRNHDQRGGTAQGKGGVRHWEMNHVIFRVGKRISAPRCISVQRDGRKRKRRRLKGRLIRRFCRPACVQKPNSPPKLEDLHRAIQAVVSNHLNCTTNESSTLTITLYGSDPDLLKSAEKAIHCSLKVYRWLLSEPRLLPGAGLAEVALAGHLTQYGLSFPGLEQLAVHAFAQAILEPVKALGQNAGVPGDLAVLALCGQQFWGAGAVEPKGCAMVLDPAVTKRKAVKRAAEAALGIITQQLRQNSEQSRHPQTDTVHS